MMRSKLDLLDRQQSVPTSGLQAADEMHQRAPSSSSSACSYMETLDQLGLELKLQKDSKRSRRTLDSKRSRRTEHYESVQSFSDDEDELRDFGGDTDRSNMSFQL